MATANPATNSLADYGYDANTGQQLAQQLGLSVPQLVAAFAATPSGPQGKDLQATISQLQMAKAAGLGSSGAPVDGSGSSGAATGGSASPSFTGNYAPGATQSYLGTGTSAGTGASMANGSPVINSGQVLYDQNGTALTPAQTAQMMSLYSKYQAGDMVAGSQAAALAHQFGINNLDTSVANLQNQTGPNAAANTVQPETAALQQMAQIDPQSEALRQQLAGSFTDPSQAANPTAAQYQSYLNTFQQVDPEEYAQRQGLATSMDSYLQQAQTQAALGSQLDPVTARQVEQQTRLGQAARGNVYGTPQMVEEAMTTGQAGLALQQQRQAQLGTALGAQQSYLGSGLGLGDTAMSLYQQGLGNKSAAQQSALSYLSSGQTPYQAGSAYVNQANQNAAMAAQGGPSYNPSSPAASYGAAQIPQYGLDIGQQAQNWYNSFSAYGGGGAPTKNKGAAAMSGAATGALSGAVGGATLGSVVPGVGTLIGAGVGAVAGGVLGGAGGYFS